ncbi:helix-turn-helix domain-containing protein [Thermogemmatispora tikiterensis]|uniref:helix-turn-helix domain-containing protein n=1 Tax=Thermogemmatispora tikiterensis TaxID=1825093 RepID=UPI000DDC1DA9|nr:helix-turn-helix transcriptional regulator [Thermogemmatispora tikiterensis]
MPIRIKIREIAQKKGIGQSRLSRLADMDIHMIQRLYRDPYANITLATLEKLSRALRVDPSELIELEPPLEEEQVAKDS